MADPANQEDVKAPPKILIVRLGAMGDVINALPAVALMRAGLGEDAVIDWLIEPRWAELLVAGGIENLATMNSAPRGVQKPLVDHIHLANTQGWRKSWTSAATLSEVLTLREDLQESDYDMAVDLQGAIKSALLAWSADTGCIVGGDTPRESLASLFHDEVSETISTHVVDQRMDISETAVSEFRNDEWKFAGRNTPHPENLPRDPAAENWCDPELTRRGISNGKRFALLTPGAGWPAKQWPAQKFGELAYALANENVPCLINTAPSEIELAEEVAAASQGRAQTISCSISQLIALCRRASVFIGGDTGPMHLANSIGIPTVALFGPTDPAFNGPYHQPNIVLRSPLSKTNNSHSNPRDEGLESISVNEVMDAVQKMMEIPHS